MKALIDEIVFGSRETSQLNLIALFRLGVEGRHVIRPASQSSVAFDAWVLRQDEALREEIEFAIEAGIDRETREEPTITIQVSDLTSANWLSDPPCLPVAAALRLLESPLKLVVENSQSDRAFLIAVAGMYREPMQKLIDTGWVEFENGGGLSNMHSLLGTHLADPQRRLRTWAMFDSDSLSPGNPSRDSQKLKRLCEKRLQGAHHQLERRAIENYLPLPALNRYTKSVQNRDEKVRVLKLYRAYGKLRADQQHHFNLKRGFEGDAKRVDATNVGDLYQNLDHALRVVLQRGFGDSIASCFNDGFALGWLLADGQTDELYPLFRQILALV